MAEEKVADLSATIADAWDEVEKTEAPAPVEAPPAPAEGRARDELGRFAPKEVSKEAAPTAPAPAEAPPVPAVQETPQHPEAQGQTTYRLPPGWSPTAKSEFERLPPELKEVFGAAIARREEEVNAGFAKLAEYKGLEEEVEWARSIGQPLPQVIKAYRAADQMLQQNPVQGITWLMQQYGIRPHDFAQQLLGQGSTTPSPGHQQPAQPMLDPAFQQYLQQQAQEVETLKRQIGAQTMERINAEIQSFKADPAHKFFDNVETDMAERIEAARLKGRAMSLKDAYEEACWANPEIREILIKEKSAASQPKPLPVKGRSPASSAPLPNVTPEARPKNRDLRDDLMAAWSEAEAHV